MSNITFHNTELHLQEHSQHEFLLSNKEVALGYGTNIQNLAHTKKNNEDELIENKHWLRLEVQTKGGKQKVIHWTKKGIVRLGFFIKSKQAREFRDWAEDYIVNTRAEHDPLLHQLQRENIELKRAINRLSQSDANDDELKKLQNENKHIKRTLIELHDRYHNIVIKSQQLEVVKKELWQMTNRFQLIADVENSGKNLNTQTIAGHSYWN